MPPCITRCQMIYVLLVFGAACVLALILTRDTGRSRRAPAPPAPPAPTRAAAGSRLLVLRAEQAHLETLHRPYAPSQFTRVGLLYRVGDDDGAVTPPPVLPLHGRATNRRALRFNYRTQSDTYNSMALNVHSATGTDCTHDDCDELQDGDVVEVRPYGRYRVDIDRD